jgi:hypothetical protein
MKDVPTMIKRMKRTTINANELPPPYSLISITTLLRVCTCYVMNVENEMDKNGMFNKKKTTTSAVKGG